MLSTELALMVEADRTRELARRLAMALANEVVFDGEDNAREETLAVLSVARDELDLREAFEELGGVDVLLRMG